MRKKLSSKIKTSKSGSRDLIKETLNAGSRTSTVWSRQEKGSLRRVDKCKK